MTPTATPREQEEPINLLRGWPASSLLPSTLLRTAATAVLSDPSIYKDALTYGPDPRHEPLRHSLATWLNNFYQRPRTSNSHERICITGGASQNLGCMLAVYSDPGYTRIWVVAPAYFLAFRIFEDAGFGGKMTAVPEDEEGVDVDFLRREMEKSERDGTGEGPKYKHQRRWGKVYRHVIYCVGTSLHSSCFEALFHFVLC